MHAWTAASACAVTIAGMNRIEPELGILTSSPNHDQRSTETWMHTNYLLTYTPQAQEQPNQSIAYIKVVTARHSGPATRGLSRPGTAAQSATDLFQKLVGTTKKKRRGSKSGPRGTLPFPYTNS